MWEPVFVYLPEKLVFDSAGDKDTQTSLLSIVLSPSTRGNGEGGAWRARSQRTRALLGATITRMSDSC